MTEERSSSGSSSPLKTMFKGLAFLLVLMVVLAVGTVFLLPTIISSDFGRNKVISAASESLQRPVSLEDLSFSWGDGLSLTNLNITNADQSPFIGLKELAVKLSWSALASSKVVIDSCLIKGLDITVIRDEAGQTSIDDLLVPAETAPTPPTKKEEKTTGALPAVFLDAHLQEGHLTFIDKRLGTTTEIRDLGTDVTVRSLLEPIDFFAYGKCGAEQSGSRAITPGGECSARIGRGDRSPQGQRHR